MKCIFSDGGRCKYFKGVVGDCVVRAICNATGRDYKEVYNNLNNFIKTKNDKKDRGNARNGISKETLKEYMEEIIKWKWVPTMRKGTGCKVHLNENELPKGILIVRLSGHVTCVKNGVLYDIYNCSRDSTRCVYGYWIKKED